MTTPAQWEQVRALFQRALELAAGRARRVPARGAADDEAVRARSRVAARGAR